MKKQSRWTKKEKIVGWICLVTVIVVATYVFIGTMNKAANAATAPSSEEYFDPRGLIISENGVDAAYVMLDLYGNDTKHNIEVVMNVLKFFQKYSGYKVTSWSIDHQALPYEGEKIRGVCISFERTKK